MAVGGGGGEEESAACRRQTFPSQNREHVPPAKLPDKFEYNSYPPSSGPHNPQPLVWGEYDEPVPQDALIHNLEHGGIGVQYGPDVSAETVEELTQWYRDDPNGLVLAPIPSGGKAAKVRDRIVLTAWTAERTGAGPSERIGDMRGRLLTCSGFDEAALSDFRDDYRGKGPENFPVAQLTPGAA